MAKNDDKIKALLTKVEEQQRALGTKPRGPWQTNGIFKYNDSSKSFFNLNAVSNPQDLVDALAFLLQRSLLQTQAAERLGIPTSDFGSVHVWDGHPVSEWEADFKKRAAMIAWDKKKAQLDETKKKLHSLVSEEAKTELELANIENLLS